MDACVQLQVKKACKEEHSGGEGKDIISRLPDGVLHHILSFLSTEDAIRTSVLSKRWEYLWTSISNIDLNDASLDRGKFRHNIHQYEALFLDLVDRVLLLHDASTIKSFRLRSRVTVYAARVNLWISAVVKHKVQDLQLFLPPTVKLVLPRSLFTCPSLVVLRLVMDCNLKVPSSIHFPNLKTLELSYVTFSDDNSTAQLCSSCPVLEDLAFLCCVWINIKNLTIRIPSLKTLSFRNLHRMFDNNSLSLEIKIYAPNLTDLDCQSILQVNILLCDLPSLDEANIDICCHRVREAVAQSAIKFLNTIRNVKSLTISSDTLLNLHSAVNLQDGLHTFASLTRLEVNSEITSHAAGIFMELLRKLPNLESLHIMGLDSITLRGEDLALGSVPCCLKSSLRTFICTVYEGRAEEMQLVRFFLENAILLETMEIYSEDFDLEDDMEKREEFKNQIKTHPRGSMRCVFNFYFC